jgi:hypothetical protein
MPSIIVTAQVEDAANWEEGFRTHGDLFREQTTTAVNFTVTNDNEVAVHFEADNLDKYMELLESPATAEAMALDGVKRETVKVFVLDKVLDL